MCRVLPSFTGFYWVLPSFTWFYRVIWGFTGIYLVLPSFQEDNVEELLQSTDWRKWGWMWGSLLGSRLTPSCTEFYRMSEAKNGTEWYLVLFFSCSSCVWRHRTWCESARASPSFPWLPIRYIDQSHAMPSKVTEFVGASCLFFLPSFNQLYRVWPSFSRFQRLLSGFTGLYRVLLGLTKFYLVFFLVLLGFTWFYRDLPGFYRVLLSFPGFYRVWRVLSWCYWVLLEVTVFYWVLWG